MVYENSYFIRCQDMYGCTPLDRVEKLCREHCIDNYADFMRFVMDNDEELAEWLIVKRGVVARFRGVMSRIAKVR